MSLSARDKISVMVRKDSFNKKVSSPKIIRKESQSTFEGSLNDDKFSGSWTSRNIQNSPTSVNASGSYSDVSTSDFIQQCITNLSSGVGSLTRRSPLPKGSEDFRKVMEEIHADERAAGQVADDNREGVKISVASQNSPKLSRTRNISGVYGGNKFAKHSHDAAMKLQIMRRISSRSLSSPTGSPRIARKNAGQWVHPNIQTQLARDNGDEKSHRSSTAKQEDIFQFSSESEEENVPVSSLSKASQKRQPLSRKRSKKSSTSLLSELTISG